MTTLITAAKETRGGLKRFGFSRKTKEKKLSEIPRLKCLLCDPSSVTLHYKPMSVTISA